MTQPEWLQRIDRLEAAVRALAESCTAEPAAHINHEGVVEAILAPATPQDETK